ncbi:uncharacterized protein V1518DRAFT_410332 [Limtongia smithiae]|uniref:uncharacterized protein n=1 Tax=Limtongia smithiae TaxID=1125753 RepID=UPI0034CF6B01
MKSLPASARSRKLRTFACSFCSMAFKRGEHLARHERSHRAERPFDCPHCDNTFGRKDILIRHTRNCLAAKAAAAATAAAAAADPALTAKQLRGRGARSNKHTTIRPVLAAASTCSSSTSTAFAAAFASFPAPATATCAAAVPSIASVPSIVIPHATNSETEDESDGESWSSFTADWSPTALCGAYSNRSESVSCFSSLSSSSSTYSSDGHSPGADWTSLINDIPAAIITSATVSSRQTPSAPPAPVAIFEDHHRTTLVSVLICLGQSDADSLLPSTSVLQSFLNAYATSFACRHPILHSTFFAFEFLHDIGPFAYSPPIDSMSQSVLLLAVFAIGAMQCSTSQVPAPTVVATAHILRGTAHRFARSLALDGNIKFMERDYLAFLQCRFLCALFDLWSGNSLLFNSLLTDLPFWHRVCVSGCRKRKLRDVSSWRNWITRQSYQRLYWACFNFLSTLDMIYAGGAVEAGVDVVPVYTLGLALPDANALWAAPSEPHWRDELAAIGTTVPTDSSSPFVVSILLHIVADYLRHLPDRRSGAQLARTIDVLTAKLAHFPRDAIPRRACDALIVTCKFMLHGVVTPPELAAAIHNRSIVSTAAFDSASVVAKSTNSAAIAVALDYLLPFIVSSQRQVASMAQVHALWSSTIFTVLWITHTRHDIASGKLSSACRTVLDRIETSVVSTTTPPEAEIIIRVANLLQSLHTWPVCEKMAVSLLQMGLDMQLTRIHSSKGPL